MFDLQHIDFKGYYAIFLRNKNLLVAPFFVTFCVVSVSSLFFPKIYESSTVIRVQQQQPNPLGTGRLVHEDLREVLRTLQEMVLSRPRLIETIQKLNLDKDIENDVELERLIASIREQVAIQRKGRELFTVSFQDKEPEKAMQVTNTVVNLFMDQSLLMKREEAFSSVDFIQKQMEIYQGKLEESDEALRKFKQEHLGEMPGEQNVNLVQLERLRDSLAETTMTLQESLGRKRFIEKQISSEKPMIVSMRSGEAASVAGQIQVLEFQLSQLMANYTDKHPDIIGIRSEIENLRRQEATPGDEMSARPVPQASELSTLNPLYQRLKEEYNHINITIETAQTRKRALEKKIVKYEKKVQSIPNQEKELAALQRDYNVNDNIYQMLLMKLEEARISKHLEFSQGGTRFQVIEPAIVPVSPIKPDRLHFLAAGLALGCAAGVGVVFLKEYLNTATRGVQQAEQVYKLPILATIPVINTQKEIRIRRRNLWWWIVSSFFFMLAVIGVVAFALLREI